MPFPYTLPIVFEGTATPLDVAGTIINDAAVEMGLAAVEDPFESDDANFVQLVALLKSLGRDLWRRHTWPALTKAYVFATEAADGIYPLPEDFGYLIQDTAWNRSTAFPVHAITPKQWQALKGQSTQVTVSNFFRIQQHQLFLLPDVSMPAGQNIAFEYVSRYWVQPSGEAAPSTTAPTGFDDVIWFDPLLCTRGLKWLFLDAKGLPTAQSASDQYQETLYLCMGDDAVAPVISSASPRARYLIDSSNLPDTGHGT